MIDATGRKKAAVAKDKVRRRIHTKIDPERYEFFPAKKQIDYYDNDVSQRVAVYARVSTGDIRQTTSYELQKKYYEDFVVRHPNWTLVKLYADEGISGTSLAHRDEFNRMIADCRAGKVDMIITKSVSRFARNVVDCISTVRMLGELPHPVGVFFESECIFSLKDDSQMALSFQDTMAQEESHIRSRSMETSLRMRLDGGLPLTPKLLGYSHDADGNLVINPEEAPTVKLIFYMYLYGYSTQEIANTMTELGKRTYLGNVKWSPNSIVQVLRNERHCGDVLTRKTWTPSYLTHKSRKNRGDRPQSLYRDHHEGIVSRDDFIAVQRMLNNAKFGGRSFIPELRVIDSGLLKGFVTVNPRWAGFKPADFYHASASVHPQPTQESAGQKTSPHELQISVAAGDFDLRGFEVAREEFFDSAGRQYIVFQDKKISLSAACVKTFGRKGLVEFLVDPVQMLFAVRSSAQNQRSAVTCSRLSAGRIVPRDISAGAFAPTLFELFGWNPSFKYRITGSLFQSGEESAYIFRIADAEAFLRPALLPAREGGDPKQQDVTPLSVSGKRVRAVPQGWAHSFGSSYYAHQRELPSPEEQNEEDWKLRLEGRLYETGPRLHITSFDTLRSFIRQELSARPGKETDGNE